MRNENSADDVQAGGQSQQATLRAYEELNDFLPDCRRKRAIPVRFLVSPTVKDVIEAHGIPHPEVDLVIVNGTSVPFEYRVKNGDRIAVYPTFESIDIQPIVRLRPAPLRRTAFVADVHLRKLTRLLRLLGLDATWGADWTDPQIVRRALEEGRIILTRDRQLLKRGEVTHGYWVRSVDAIEQAREVVRRFDLAAAVHPYTRCPVCNGAIRSVSKADVLERIPPKTAAWLDEYFECVGCGKLYWRGTHTQRLNELLTRILRSD